MKNDVLDLDGVVGTAVRGFEIEFYGEEDMQPSVRGDIALDTGSPMWKSDLSRMHNNGRASIHSVRLTSRPLKSVTLQLTTDNDVPGERVLSYAVDGGVPCPGGGDGICLLFTPDDGSWNVPQEVALVADDDNIMFGSRTIRALHALESDDINVLITEHSVSVDGITTLSNTLDSELAYHDTHRFIPTEQLVARTIFDGIMTVTVADDDTPGVSVSSELLTIAEGEEESYWIVLDSEPIADVDISISVVNDTMSYISIDPASLVFTSSDWNIPQNVNISAKDDSIFQGSFSSLHSYSPTLAQGDPMLLKHVLTSADPLYNYIDIGTNEINEDIKKVVDQGGILVQLQENDTGCSGAEYSCSHGVCPIESLDETVSYLCSCSDGYTGQECEIACNQAQCKWMRLKMITRPTLVESGKKWNGAYWTEDLETPAERFIPQDFAIGLASSLNISVDRVLLRQWSLVSCVGNIDEECIAVVLDIEKDLLSKLFELWWTETLPSQLGIDKYQEVPISQTTLSVKWSFRLGLIFTCLILISTWGLASAVIYRKFLVYRHIRQEEAARLARLRNPPIRQPSFAKPHIFAHKVPTFRMRVSSSPIRGSENSVSQDGSPSHFSEIEDPIQRRKNPVRRSSAIKKGAFRKAVQSASMFPPPKLNISVSASGLGLLDDDIDSFQPQLSTTSRNSVAP
eukprot:TRINITY_DN2598_c1_g2_i1.p1 TRINITY_DN2598_c1_g2~~TRINITY_DN2598_c1_g2_i1.p1  ORF type:complete len:774 (+),score=206.36 TRINITY_DN2598_c1_g2_i1:269-2323(+)